MQVDNDKTRENGLNILARILAAYLVRNAPQRHHNTGAKEPAASSKNDGEEPGQMSGDSVEDIP